LAAPSSASLKSLPLENHQSYEYPEKALRGYLSWTDLTKLRALSLRRRLDVEEFQILIDLATNGTLDHLHELSLPSDIVAANRNTEESMLDNNLRRALPHPMSLTVTDGEKNVLAPMLPYQGPYLSKLHLTTFVEHDQFVNIQTQCPNLEDVRIVIDRSLGDRHQVQLYKTLDSWPKLSHLILLLNTTDHFSDDSEDAIRHTLMSSTIDANLAQSTLNVIFSANRGPHSTTLPTFTSLKTSPIERWRDGPYHLAVESCHSKLIQYLAKSWN
jgi:hypothetical protein